VELESQLLQYKIHRDTNQPFTLLELQQLISVIDLTALNLEDEDQTIVKLCEKAMTPYGDVAAVCVYPKFVAVASDIIGTTAINIASVANFPTGNESLTLTLDEIHHSLVWGANEIDVVFPYQDYLNGERERALDYIAQCQRAAPISKLKVILETSAFPNIDEIYAVSQKLIDLGIDFLKTSTGKSHQGATLDGAGAMLLAIKESKSEIGFKASGGIRTVLDAYRYIDLAKSIMGEQWVNPNHFRIGASSLLDEALTLAGNIISQES
jgi:deoxyribose-phosphate aldolase